MIRVEAEHSTGPLRLKSILLPVLLLSAGFLYAGLAHAHGTHAQYRSPMPGEIISGSFSLEVEKPPRDFPFIHATIRPTTKKSTDQSHADDGNRASHAPEVWSGLIPLGDDGYIQSIDVSEWATGMYLIEVRLLGDYLENIRYRTFTVSRPDDD